MKTSSHAATGVASHDAAPAGSRLSSAPRAWGLWPGRPGLAEGPGARARALGWLDTWLLGRVQQTISGAPICFRLWNGLQTTSCPLPVGTMVIHDRATLARLAMHPELYFGEAYAEGRIEIHGELVEFLEAAFRVFTQPRGTAWWLPLARWLQGRNTVGAARRNIHRHYDIGNDFYRLWLDEALLYTCAYYPDASASLDEAQVAKLDHVCRKLRLRPGERVLEVGCGWGALALHMARGYGVSVKAYNISTEQVRYARARAATEGLADRVEFVEDDYRAATGTFDAFVSIGMLEHVGLFGFRALGETIDRTLPRDRGRGLLHFIGRNRPRPLNPWIRRRIFPGAYPPALGETVAHVLEPWDFSVLDVENLRLHYARTLRDWLSRFTANEPVVRRMFDERFVRTWRLYLASSAAAFGAGDLQLFQLLFARGGDNDVAWSRAHLYSEDGRR